MTDHPRRIALAIALAACVLLPACKTSRDEAKNKTDATSKEESKADAKGGQGKKEEQKKDAAKDEGVPVRVATLAAGPISSYVLCSSRIEAETTADVQPEVSGMVVELKADEGHTVKAGEALVQLNEEDFKLAEAKAKAKLEKCRAELTRAKRMHSGSVTSDEALEKAEYEARQAELDWKEAKLALDRTQIRAPIPGVVSKRMVRIGDRVSPATKLFSLVDLDSLMVKVALPGRELRNVKEGQRALIISDFLPDRKFEGKLRRISPVVDPDTGTFEALIDIPGDKEGLKPGMFVDVRLVVDTHESAILVPKRAIVHDGYLKYVMVIRREVVEKSKEEESKPDDATAAKKKETKASDASDDGGEEKKQEQEAESKPTDGEEGAKPDEPPEEAEVAYRILLDAGYSDIDQVEALSGLAIGDTIVLVGQTGLKDKAKVKIVERELPDGSVVTVETDDKKNDETDGDNEDDEDSTSVKPKT